jgi:hypothetical protein
MTLKIFTSKHTLFAANILMSNIKSLGYQCEIVDSVDYRDPSYYIIYNSALMGRMPRNYIIMQTEVRNSHWFNEHYLNIIKRAKAVWDYSVENIPSYSGYNRKICIVTPGINLQNAGKKDIDYLFYGWLEGSFRRVDMIQKIKKKIPLLVVTNKLGNDMWSILKRSRVVINLRYYDHSPLELFRINESLSHCCNVVSEGFNQHYSNVVSFKSDVDEIIESAVESVKNEFDYDLSHLNNSKEIINGLALAGI